MEEYWGDFATGSVGTNNSPKCAKCLLEEVTQYACFYGGLVSGSSGISMVWNGGSFVTEYRVFAQSELIAGSLGLSAKYHIMRRFWKFIIVPTRKVAIPPKAYNFLL